MSYTFTSFGVDGIVVEKRKMRAVGPGAMEFIYSTIVKKNSLFNF
jgi:hypothetical protein